MEGICNSKRRKGLSDLMYAVKAPLRQALVLSVRQVLMIHELLESAECNVVDRAVAAYLLVALYGRCRHSDLQNIEDAFVDLGPEGGYLGTDYKDAQNVQDGSSEVQIATDCTACDRCSRP